MSQWNSESIKRARKKEGWTQMELAEKLGCRQQTVSEWEIGLYAPKNAYQRILTQVFCEVTEAPPAKAVQEQNVVPTV